MTEQYYKFQLSFKGQLVENSVDAFDVANTIIAFSQAIQKLAEIHYGVEEAKKIKINVNAFREGSLATDFLLLIKDVKEMAEPLIPLVATSATSAVIKGKEVLEVGKDLLDSYKVITGIKTLLRGKKPKDVKALPDGRVSMNIGDNNVITVNMFDFRGLQSKELNKDLARMVAPLLKEDSLLKEIDVIPSNNDAIALKKEEAEFIASKEDTQLIEKVKYKGIVSKIDTKACSGYLDISSRRLSFTFPKSLPDEQFIILVESLKKRIQIYIVGDVTMDFENNPSSVFVTEVLSDIKLF